MINDLMQLCKGHHFKKLPWEENVVFLIEHIYQSCHPIVKYYPLFFAAFINSCVDQYLSVASCGSSNLMGNVDYGSRSGL